jgi:hypothetical protein
VTTPAERLLAAADLLDKRAGEATEGPWRNHDTYLNLGGYTATVLSGKSDDVHLVAHLPSYSHDSSQFQEQPHADARYMATMHPEVGKALAALMRWEADCVAFNDGRCALALADLLLAGES